MSAYYIGKGEGKALNSAFPANQRFNDIVTDCGASEHMVINMAYINFVKNYNSGGRACQWATGYSEPQRQSRLDNQ